MPSPLPNDNCCMPAMVASTLRRRYTAEWSPDSIECTLPSTHSGLAAHCSLSAFPSSERVKTCTSASDKIGSLRPASGSNSIRTTDTFPLASIGTANPSFGFGLPLPVGNKSFSKSDLRSASSANTRNADKRSDASARFQITTCDTSVGSVSSTSHHGDLSDGFCVWVTVLSSNLPELLPSIASLASPLFDVDDCRAVPRDATFSPTARRSGANAFANAPSKLSPANGPLISHTPSSGFGLARSRSDLSSHSPCPLAKAGVCSLSLACNALISSSIEANRLVSSSVGYGMRGDSLPWSVSSVWLNIA